jgi:hypothetical protein
VLSFCLQLLISKKKTSFSRTAFFPCRWLSENFFYFLFYLNTHLCRSCWSLFS